jgi:hypothetical protein
MARARHVFTVALIDEVTGRGTSFVVESDEELKMAALKLLKVFVHIITNFFDLKGK